MACTSTVPRSSTGPILRTLSSARNQVLKGTFVQGNPSNVFLQEAEVEYVEGYEGEEEDDLEDFDQLAEEEYEDEGKRSPGYRVLSYGELSKKTGLCVWLGHRVLSSV
jgi:hypothetical protein